MEDVGFGGFVFVRERHRLRDWFGPGKFFDFGEEIGTTFFVFALERGVEVGVGDADFVFGFENEIGLFGVAFGGGGVVSDLGFGRELRDFAFEDFFAGLGFEGGEFDDFGMFV